MNKRNYKIVPIDPGFVDRAREGRDDQGQPVQRHVASGGEPLRDSLRRARAGENILLASYCPFDLAGPYKEFGPVFISAEPSGAAPDLFKLFAGADGSYLGASFVLRAYSADERIVDAVVTSSDAAEENLTRFFAGDEVAFVLARFAAYGCYGCRLERI